MLAVEPDQVDEARPVGEEQHEAQGIEADLEVVLPEPGHLPLAGDAVEDPRSAEGAECADAREPEARPVDAGVPLAEEAEGEAEEADDQGRGGGEHQALPELDLGGRRALVHRCAAEGDQRHRPRRHGEPEMRGLAPALAPEPGVRARRQQATTPNTSWRTDAGPTAGKSARRRRRLSLG